MNRKVSLLSLIGLMIVISITACGGSETTRNENQTAAETIVTEIEVTRLVEVVQEVQVEITRLVEIEVTRVVEVEKEIPVTVTPEPVPTVPPAPDEVEIDMTEMVIWPGSSDYVHVIFFASNPSDDYAIEYTEFDFVMTGADGELIDTNIDIVDIPPGGRVPVYTVMSRGDRSIEDIIVEVEADGRYVLANQYPDNIFTISDISQPSPDKLLGYITNEGTSESSGLMEMALIPYDEEGVPLAYEYTYPDAMAPGETTTFEFSMYGDRFSQMADYEIFVLP